MYHHRNSHSFYTDVVYSPASDRLPVQRYPHKRDLYLVYNLHVLYFHRVHMYKVYNYPLEQFVLITLPHHTDGHSDLYPILFKFFLTDTTRPEYHVSFSLQVASLCSFDVGCRLPEVLCKALIVVTRQTFSHLPLYMYFRSKRRALR